MGHPMGYPMGHLMGHTMVHVLNHAIHGISHVVFQGIPCPMTYPIDPMGPLFHGISHGIFSITSHGLRHDTRWPALWTMPIHLIG